MNSTPSTFKRAFVGDDAGYATQVDDNDLFHVAGRNGPILRVISAGADDFVSIASHGYADVRSYGAVGDGVTDDTTAINAAIAAVGTAGGGIVSFSPGTYLVSCSNPDVVSTFSRRALWVGSDNITLSFARGSAILKLADDANCTVIKVGDHASAVSVENVVISGVEIDGNSANQMAPAASTDHYNGIDVGSGSHRITIENFHIYDCQHYGIGFVRTDFRGCRVSDGLIERTGADGIDCKDDDETSTGNVIDMLEVRDFGLATDLDTGQAGIDVRSGWKVTRANVRGFAGALADVGIRMQQGLVSGIPAQPPSLDNFEVKGNGGNEIGVRAIGGYLRISNGRVISCEDGYSISNPDHRMSFLFASECVTGFRLWQSASTGEEADTATLTGLIARSNSMAGIVLNSVDEITLLGCDIRNNAIGLDARTGCTNIRMFGGSLSGNTTQLNDPDGVVVVEHVSGFRTEQVLTTVVGIDAAAGTGVKNLTFNHTLAVTPSLDDVQLTLYRITNVGDWTAGFMWATSVSSTQITAQIRITAVSATAGAELGIRCVVKAKGRLV